MTPINNKQIQIIQTILSKRHSDRDERLEFLESFFNQKITSTKDLSWRQANDLIYYLKNNKLPGFKSWAWLDRKKSEHRKIEALAKEYNWLATDGYVDQNELGKWIVSNRCPVKGKSLIEMTKIELEKIIRALENMVKSKWK